MDPFEKQDGQKSNDFAMKLGVAWGGQVQDALASTAIAQGFPPRQRGGTLTPRPDDQLNQGQDLEAVTSFDCQHNAFMFP